MLLYYITHLRQAVVSVIEALRYKLERSGFDY
jgi:hypothetical protein